MCGIVGYIGKEQAAPILLEGLARLEYRGYDSAGICVAENGVLDVAKCKGRLKNLAAMTENGALLHGTAGHRAHPLGNPRRAERYQLPSPCVPERQGRVGSQRHH